MIEFRKGDIVGTDAEALVNTVNCIGIMGRGIALQFKRSFPSNFLAYAAACKRGDVQPGRMFVFETERLTNPRYIINFPTKRHWRGKSKLADIEKGLEALVVDIKRLGIRSIAIPPLGSGLGGLDWQAVRPMIESALARVPDVQAVVYEPRDGPVSHDMVKSPEAPPMTPGRAAVVGLIQRYLAGLMDPFITLLEIHKLMYFMQESGEKLKLRYVAGPYGPYAENLRHVLRDIEGHFVMGYADGGDEPNKELALVPGAVQDAAAFLEQHAVTRERFSRVADLVAGYESSFGLELLATVHWLATKDGVVSADDIIERTYAWGDRKRMFTEAQIHDALEVLKAKGWVEQSN